MGHTYKKHNRFDEDQAVINRTNHSNNKKFNGLPILNDWVLEPELFEDSLEEVVDSSINKR